LTVTNSRRFAICEALRKLGSASPRMTTSYAKRSSFAAGTVGRAKRSCSLYSGSADWRTTARSIVSSRSRKFLR